MSLLSLLIILMHSCKINVLNYLCIYLTDANFLIIFVFYDHFMSFFGWNRYIVIVNYNDKYNDRV